MHLLIERVIVTEHTLEILWRASGWRDLVGELNNNTIGGEMLLAESEQEALA